LKNDRFDELLINLGRIIGDRLVKVAGIEGVNCFFPWMEEAEPEMARLTEQLRAEANSYDGKDYKLYRAAVVKYSRHLTAMIEKYKKAIKTGGYKLSPKKGEKQPLQPIPEAGQEWRGASTRPPESQKELF